MLNQYSRQLYRLDLFVFEYKWPFQMSLILKELNHSIEKLFKNVHFHSQKFHSFHLLFFLNRIWLNMDSNNPHWPQQRLTNSMSILLDIEEHYIIFRWIVRPLDQNARKPKSSRKDKEKLLETHIDVDFA